MLSTASCMACFASPRVAPAKNAPLRSIRQGHLQGHVLLLQFLGILLFEVSQVLTAAPVASAEGGVTD